MGPGPQGSHPTDLSPTGGVRRWPAKHEGERASAKHGGRGQRRWKKLHLGVDGSGVVFRLPLRQAEGFVRSVPSSMERQCSLDREIRESLLPAGSTGRRSSPPVPRVGRKLQRHVTSLHECSLVLRPVSDAVFGLVRGVDSRLHDEIVRHGPSTRPGHRTRPQARG